MAFLPPIPQLDTDDLFSLVRWRKPVRRWRVKARGAEFRRMRVGWRQIVFGMPWGARRRVWTWIGCGGFGGYYDHG